VTGTASTVTTELKYDNGLGFSLHRKTLMLPLITEAKQKWVQRDKQAFVYTVFMDSELTELYTQGNADFVRLRACKRII
jgi:hypothetical protein